MGALLKKKNPGVKDWPRLGIGADSKPIGVWFEVFRQSSDNFQIFNPISRVNARAVPWQFWKKLSLKIFRDNSSGNQENVNKKKCFSPFKKKEKWAS